MEVQLNTAFSLVSQPNNQSIKEGEHLLNLLKKDKTYPIALLHYMNSSNIQPNGKLRAAIELKLWCEFFKNLQEFQRNFYGDVLQSIKQSILYAYLNFSIQISKTLRPGIVSLADVLFPYNWQNLMLYLINYSKQNSSSINTVLKLIEDITVKYTHLSRSDPLYEEIIKVCDEIHDFLKDLTTMTLQTVINDNNKQNESIMLETLMKLFYNLNYQDLHPKYEDNLQDWMDVLKAVMKLPNSNQYIFKCKGAALQAILLYANKYKEDVEQTIKEFCFQVWSLCAKASQDPQLDSIVFNCLKFFKSLMNWQQMKPFFAQNMDQLFSMLILPNIRLNQTAKGLFEDQPDVYIDYYFRNTEIQTRRAGAIELLRIICRYYNAFQPFLQRQIQIFMDLSEENILAECILLGLVIDGSSKGFRDIDGCTQLFVSPQIIEYCYHKIAKKSLGIVYEWSTINKETPLENRFNVMHVATLIRFLFYFRIYLPKEELSSVLQFLASLRSNHVTLKKVIYLSINGFMVMRHGDFESYKNLTFYFNSQNLKPIAFDLLKLIYEGTRAEKSLQDGLTKMFYNLSKTLRQANCQFFYYQKQIIKQMLDLTVQYDFDSAQFLFQTIGYLSFFYIKANSNDKNTLEEIVLSYFQTALSRKSDLLNFCLQILAIFLQLQPTSNYQYQVIYQALLLQQNWKEQNQSLMSSYIQFIISFLARNRPRLISDRPAIEVILSKIIEIDHVQLFFRFLEAIMLNTSLEQFSNSGYMSIVVQGCRALAHSIQGKKSSLLFVSKLIVHYNNHIETLRMINHCCPNFYDQLLEASCDILQTISVKKDRKCIFIAICKAVQSNYFVDSSVEGLVLNSLISNTVDRFNLRNISSYVIQNQRKEKKEATYKKIQAFKQFQMAEVEMQVDEQQLFVKTFKNAVGQRGNLLNFINEKNKERIMRLDQKYRK